MLRSNRRSAARMWANGADNAEAETTPLADSADTPPAASGNRTKSPGVLDRVGTHEDLLSIADVVRRTMSSTASGGARGGIWSTNTDNTPIHRHANTRVLLALGKHHPLDPATVPACLRTCTSHPPVTLEALQLLIPKLGVGLRGLSRWSVEKTVTRLCCEMKRTVPENHAQM